MSNRKPELLQIDSRSYSYVWLRTVVVKKTTKSSILWKLWSLLSVVK